MKDYEQMAKDVLRRIEEEKTARKRRKARRSRLLISLCCVCLAGLAAAVLYGGKNGGLAIVPLSAPGDSARSEAPVQTEDIIGWIVYNGVTYYQDTSAPDTVLPGEYLGLAQEFEGAYKTPKTCDGRPGEKIGGKVYAVKDAPDLLLIKLDNGADIVLRAQENTPPTQ